MKKVLFLTLSVLTMNVFIINAQIVQLIDPAISRGYLMWENISQATAYKLEFFIQDSNQTQIAEFELNSNYHRVDPLLFTVPNVAYTITAFNGSNVISTSTTSVVSKLPDHAYGTWEDDCAINCNGRTYAWKLTAGGRVEHPAEVRLQLSSVYQYYDAELGVATPYWQAMSYSSYNNLTNHPYKQNSTSGYPNYRKEHIDISMISGPTPYRDRSNSPVSSGWLIEKKLDEFTHLNSAMTVSSASPNTDVCAVDDIYYWKGFFNNYVDLTPISMPSSVEPFMNTVPNGVECLKTYDNINVSEDDINDFNWNAWVDTVYNLVDDIEEGIFSSGDGKLFNELTSQLDALINTNYSKDSITFVSIKSIGLPGQSDAIIKRDFNGFYLLSSSGPFKAGLYEIAFRSARGNVFPAVIKFSSDLLVHQFKETIDVIAFPNPITNNQLNIKITSDQAVFARLILGDNTGNLIINEEIKIDKEDVSTFTYDLSNVTSSNYLILNVVYPDASVDQITLIKQ